MAKFFIYHPRFAGVLSLVISIAGLLALLTLPVAQYPEIAPPEVVVSAVYTGADAKTVRETVGAVIEKEVNGVEDMIYMKSTSANDGTYTLIVTFDIGTDADKAQTLVQNRVNKAMPLLPQDVRRSGVTVEKESSTILMVVSLTDETEAGTYDDLFLVNYALLNINDALLRINGVGKVNVLNALDYSIRVWLDPLKMRQSNITAQDVVAAIEEQNVVAAAGQIGSGPSTEDQKFQYTIQAKGRMESAEEFEEIILRASPDGATLTLGDVARVQLGAQQYLATGALNGQGAAVVAIYQQPGANALSVADAVRHELETMSGMFPKGLGVEVPYDSTAFVELSIEEVYETLVIAVALVVLVVFVFLQSVKATLIPAIAIPVSLMGTFAAMSVLGFSVNLITLFGLILAIGVVVDAAMIVLENVERLVREEPDLTIEQATEKAMSQVTAPLIASALVLLAVFIPVSLIPGLTGQIFNQFGMVLSVSVVLSTVVALTLTPPLCVMLVSVSHSEPMWILRKFNDLLEKVTNGYMAVAMFLCRRLSVSIAVFVGLLVAIYVLATTVPTALTPKEDSGNFFVELQLPDAASLVRTNVVMEKAIADVRAIEGVRDVISVAGFSLLDGATASNSGILIVALDHWSKRTDPDLKQSSIFAKVSAKLDTYDDALAIPFEPPTIPGLGMSAGYEFVLQDRLGRSPDALSDGADLILGAAKLRDEIGFAYTTFSSAVPQLFLDVDRQKVKAAGVAVNDFFFALQVQMGGFYINDINLFGRNTPVMIQAEPQFRDAAGDLLNIYVRNGSGGLTPVGGLATLDNMLGPRTLTRYNMFNAAALNGEPAQGFSSGGAVGAMQEIATDQLPQGFSYEWTGATFQELAAGNTAAFAFALAFLFAYLFLVAQYESWSIPIAILLVVPTAILGVFLHTSLAGGTFNIFTQIGLVVMIGMAARNAILVVEFAKQLHESGLEILEAAEQAARLRFRPLLMTAFAFILGVFPLVIASGAGDGSRRALGQAVFGGMVTAVIIGSILTPSFFVMIARLRRKSRP